MRKLELPFEDGIDDPHYVYRFQTCADLRHMRQHVGKYLAASRWDPNTSCNHKHYEALQQTLSKGQSIYTLSVWRNEAAAWNGWPRAGRQTDRVLMRIPRDVFECRSWNCVDDDKLDGAAFLMFQVAPYEDGQVYGGARIPWSVVQQTDGSWHPVWPDKEDLRAVGDPFAYTYNDGEVPSRDLDYDFGLPSDEKVLRVMLHRLDRLESKLASIPRWKIHKYRKSRTAFFEALDIWRSLPHSDKRIRAADLRIISLLPDDHNWHQFFDVIPELSNAKQSQPGR